MYEYETPEPVELLVELASGDVDVTASDVSTTTVEVVPADPTDERGGQLAARTIVQRTVRKVSVISPDRGGLFRRTSPLRVAVTVPHASSVQAKVASADLRITGPIRDLITASASGDLTAERVDGTARINTSGGTVRLGAVAGDVRCGLASGDVWVGGAVLVKSASGDLHLGSSRGDVRFRASSGDVDIQRATAGGVDVQVASGTITVGVPAGVPAYLDLETVGGRTASELPVNDDPPDAGPQLSLRLRSHSGDIVVRRATADSPEPAPA